MTLSTGRPEYSVQDQNNSMRLVLHWRTGSHVVGNETPGFCLAYCAPLFAIQNSQAIQMKYFSQLHIAYDSS